jgi:hypothetical protein
LLGAAGLFFVVLLLILHRATLGSVDPDPVDFERLNVGQGRYLICPRDICPGHDEEPPLFTISAERLMQKLRAVALAEPRLREVALPMPNQLRFIETSSLLRIETVIDVRIIARSSGASTLAMLGRPASPVLDFGATRQRMTRWLEGIAR